MGRTTTAWDDVLEPGDLPLEDVEETGWRAFLRSWKWGAILALGCVFGLIAIFSAQPFASASVSERVSEKLGQPSSCTEVGAAQVGEAHSTIYRCTVGLATTGSAQCFAISGDDIKQIGGNREDGC
jgi:hypothetical protein